MYLYVSIVGHIATHFYKFETVYLNVPSLLCTVLKVYILNSIDIAVFVMASIAYAVAFAEGAGVIFSTSRP